MKRRAKAGRTHSLINPLNICRVSGPGIGSGFRDNLEIGGFPRSGNSLIAPSLGADEETPALSWLNLSLPLRLALFALAIFASASVSALCSFSPQDFVAIWPAAGVALAVLALERRCNWIAFAAAAFTGHLVSEITLNGHGTTAGLTMFAATQLQAVAGAVLLQHFSSGTLPCLNRVRDVLAIAVAALLGPVVSASIGLLTVLSGDSEVSPGRLWQLWWAADAIGAVVFAPFLLSVLGRPIRLDRTDVLKVIEFFAAFGGLALTAQSIFGDGGEGRDVVLSFPFFTIPFLFWTSLRFGVRGAATACVLLAAITAVNTAHGSGPFPFTGGDPSGHVFLVQTFIAVSTLSTILLATTMEERFRTEAQIRSLNLSLEHRVIERTAALAASEGRFQTLAEAAPVGIFTTNEYGRCVYVNDRWCELTGLDSVEAVGRCWLDYVDPEDRGRVAARWDVAREDRETFQLEFRLRNAQGASTWVFGQARPDGNKSPEVSGYIGTVTDINERKASEHALQEAHDDLEERINARTRELFQKNLDLAKSEQRIRSVIDSASDAFIAVDAQGVITDWNPRAVAVFGLAREEVAGRALAQIVLPPDGEEGHRNALDYLFATGGGPLLANRTQFRARRADGSTFPAEMTMSPAGYGDARFFSIFLRDITERHNAEKAVRESESVLRSFFNSTPMMMGLVELLHDDVLHVSDNAAAARFFGTSPEALHGKYASELGIPRPHLRLWISHYRESEKSGHPLHFEYTADTPSGPRHLSVTVCYATRGPSGRPQFAYTIEDITDRRLAEKDLREKTDALENAAEGIARVDSQGRIQSVNKAYADLSGFTPEELVGEEWLRVTHTDDRPLMKIAYRTMLEQGKSELEVRGVRKDGTAFFQQQVLVSTYDEQGRFIGHYAFVRDISSRKRAENERDRFFTLSLDMLCIAGTNGYFRRLNPAFEHTLGFSIAELQAAPLIHFVHPEDRQKTLDVFLGMHEGRECIDFENRFRCKDGAYRWLSWTVTPYSAEEIIYAVARDVTERKRAEQSIIASLEEKDVLLKEIHHRVKNNLQVISSLLQLQSSYIKDERTIETFRESQNRIRSMAMIHEKLYQTESLARIDFEDYASGLAAMLMRSYSTTSGVKLRTAIEKVTLGLDTAVPIGLITNELLSNSLKYAFPNARQGVVRVALATGSDPGSYKLEISDDGVGLPSDFQPEKASSLGFRLVKILTNQIGGTLTCTTGKQGTAFAVSFSDGK